MLDNIPIQRRLMGILGLMALAFLFLILYGIQVMGRYNRITQLEQLIAPIETLDIQLITQKVKLKQLDDEIRNLQQGRLSIQTHNQFLEYMEALTARNQVNMIAHPRQTLEQVQDYQLARISFTLEGSFHNLLQLSHQLEHQDRVATIDHLNLQIETVRLKNKKKELLTATFQVTRLSNEN